MAHSCLIIRSAANYCSLSLSLSRLRLLPTNALPSWTHNAHGPWNWSMRLRIRAYIHAYMHAFIDRALDDSALHSTSFQPGCNLESNECYVTRRNTTQCDPTFTGPHTHHRAMNLHPSVTWWFGCDDANTKKCLLAAVRITSRRCVVRKHGARIPEGGHPVPEQRRRRSRHRRRRCLQNPGPRHPHRPSHTEGARRYEWSRGAADKG
mmetsp:Transcript_14039/g.38570  ORF Transcript_14039/g.38570 Transcript_14039/m.38570 type:complete len:207 (+) Transcript_14039:137-757(+)